MSQEIAAADHLPEAAETAAERHETTSAVYLERSDPTVACILRAAFPGFNGKSIKARIVPRITFHGTNWDEGNKRDYAVIRLADMARVPISEAPYWQPHEAYTIAHEIPVGCVVVVYVRSGLREHVEIHGPAGNVQALLPPPILLSDDERTVLSATRSLKSSYAGIKDYRYQECGRPMGRARWDAAKASLITRKFLNAAGAITTSGRNAIA